MSNALLFEGRDLEEVLGEARLCFGPDVEIEAANRVRKGGVMGFFAREWYEVWARSPEGDPNPALALIDREASQADGNPDSFQSMVTNALAAQSGPDRFEAAMSQFFTTDGESGEPERPARPVSGDIVARREPEAPAGGVATLERSRTRADVVAVTPEPGLAVIPDTSAAIALEDAPRGSSVFTPARTARPVLLWQMLERIETATSMISLPESGVVVFIGDAELALPAVQALGQRENCWSSEVGVVTRRSLESVPAWLSIDSDEDLQARLPRWRRRAGVVPVIIDQPIDAPNIDAALQILDLIDPAQTRLVTEAWRLPEQAGRLASRMGGIDAIDLVDTADAIDPLGMIDLDIPIGSVEGRPATADLLAAVWLERRRNA